MHNLDTTLNLNESEYELNFSNEMQEYESESETLSEMEQLESAAELLEVSNEQELEGFLGDIISSAGHAVADFARSSTGQALGGILKSAAKQAIPILGGAVGGYIGGPAGAKLGSMAADKAGQMLGLELEGLSHEDKEFEVARQVVRLASDASRAAADAHGSGPAQDIARQAFIQAAQVHAPGLIRPVNGAGTSSNGDAIRSAGEGRSGRWHRHGSKIILLGV